MAIMWEQSLHPWIDPNGDPYAGAKAYFFDAGTTTPIPTYTEASLSTPHDHPVVADASGQFPAVFLVEQITYRVRIVTEDGVTLHDVDNISTPTTVVPDPPEGDTEAQYLHQTGDIKMAWRNSAPTGWVRLNGRTIGSSSSFATERANDDCEDLFEYLWDNDANLAVSGGRGASAAGDYAAAKTIALPDFRGRVMVAPDSFGNSAAGRVTDAVLGADSDTKGSAGGAGTHTLTENEMPEHTHEGTTAAAGAHTHSIGFQTSKKSGLDGDALIGSGSDKSVTTASSGAHTHTLTIGTAGSGAAHNNIQPSIIVPFFMKL